MILQCGRRELVVVLVTLYGSQVPRHLQVVDTWGGDSSRYSSQWGWMAHLNLVAQTVAVSVKLGSICAEIGNLGYAQCII